jgi:uncharacterized membrane protein
VPNVADLERGKPDSLGETVLAFFARKPPHYAVYGVRRRVAIQFADDATEADAQRKVVIELAPLRGEIDGLIDGWRSGSAHSFFGLENAAQLKSKADRYERRVADALAVALEGQLPLAKETLAAIKRDIVNERTAWARFEYLIGAFAMALLIMLVAFLAVATYPFGSPHATDVRRWWVAGIAIGFGLVIGVSLFLAGSERARVRSRAAKAATGGQDEMRGNAEEEDEEEDGATMPSPSIVAVPAMLLFLLLVIPVLAVLLKPSFSYGEHLALRDLNPAIDLWRAAAAGAVGAFFSIAIGIRTRTVLPDLLRTSNLMDAVLRVIIGFIAGAVLMALIKAGLVSVQIGSTPVKDAGALTVVLFGFFAGFSERLVPDLLAKASASTGGSTDAAAGSAGTRAGSAVNPTPPPPPPPPSPGDAPPGSAPGAAPSTQDPVPEQAAEDGCAADVELSDDEVASDDDLPPAAGGVEKPVEGGTT